MALTRDGTSSRHDHERGSPPAELAAADAFVSDLITALRTCVASARIDPDPGCTPG